MTAPAPRFKRVILKLSGEMLKGPLAYGHDRGAVEHIANEVCDAYRLGIEVGVVIGGGNIFRGNSDAASTMNRSVADHIGMIATVINALMLQDAIERQDIPTRVMTAIPIDPVAEPYIRRRAIRHLEQRRVVIFGGGTGSTHFSTDSAAALRGAETEAEVILKGTKVDGVYTADPRKVPDAKFLETCTYQRALVENLNVMDSAAISLSRESNLPIIVYNLAQAGNTRRVLTDGDIGTLIGDPESARFRELAARRTPAPA
ncbi:MAG: UMP kinase [Candidatus Sumerlaeia bacterium]|nr:UMP kinase [Candidatus Sumerlaeia bacterium]